MKILRACPYITTLGLKTSNLNEVLLEDILDLVPAIQVISIRGEIGDGKITYVEHYRYRRIEKLDFYNGILSS
jgi:hypothetical protein